MLVNTFNFEVYDLGNNLYSFVDKTSYPATSNFGFGANDVENNAGRIIAYSSDDFASDYNYVYFDNTVLTDPVELQAQLIDQQYLALAILVPEWSNIQSVGLIFNPADVCIYDGEYYIYEGSTGGISTAPDLDADWVLLTSYTDSEIWTKLSNLINNANHKCSWDYLIVNETSNKDKTYVISCHKGGLYLANTSSVAYVKITISEYDGSIVTGYDSKQILNDSGASSMEIEYEVLEDQQYIIKVEKYDDTDTQIGDDVYLTQLFMCDYKKCYNDMVHAIYCCDCPDDPCDQAENNKLDTRYKNLLRLESMFMTIMQMVNVEAVRYLGVYDMDDDRENFASQVQEYMAKINLLVDRCDCNNATEDNPCNNC